MKPKPWSATTLEDFVTCPRAYHAKKVAKTHVEVRGEATVWGEVVHKWFEDRVNFNTPLPVEVSEHEKFIADLIARPGHIFAEQEIALNTKALPCGFWDKNVWFRGKIDVLNINGDDALVTDYKTGKPHNKFQQLMMFAIHTFALHPDVMTVTAQYYWTKTLTTTSQTYHRHQIHKLWDVFVPSLKQWVEAFRLDVWQPRPSGLCNGWCPVTDCEHWKPKRERR